MLFPVRHATHLTTVSMHGLLIAALLFGATACSSASKISVQQGQVLRDVDDMRNRAYRCAPRELALAESHADFAAWELDQGNLRRAQDHILVAMKNSEAADLQSRAPACQDVQVAIVEPPEPEPTVGDADGDGLLDDVDQCPLDPEDFDGFEDTDGCPDADNDADLVCDPWVAPAGREADFPCKGVDQCPDEAEDFDGFQDEDGCPELDNDNDKILDVDDTCPLEPEVYNGFNDEDGCPDELKLIKVTEDRIELNEPVFFATDKTKVLPRSEPLLDEIANVLRASPDIEVRIEGHTDSVGKDKYNKKLSQGRADSVREELIDRGIEAYRMTALGWGEERPIDTNETKEGRANNRRVEFHITKR